MKKINFFIRQYLSHRPAFYSFIRPLEAMFFEKNKKLIKKKILDFGCGDGFFTSLIFNKDGIDLGLDLFNSRAYEAKKIKTYRKIIFYDGIKIPFKDNYFETIISNCVLEHIPQLNQTLKEIYRVLKKGGYFLTTVMSNKWETNLFFSHFFGDMYKNFLKKKQQHFNLLSKKKWRKEFEKVGFKLISCHPYLTKRQSQMIDIFHYLSTPSLLSYKLFNRWIIFKNWWMILKLDKWIEKKLREKATLNNSSAFTFVLLK